MSFFKATKQNWKLISAIVPFAIFGALVIFQSYLYEPFGEDQTMSIILIAGIIGIFLAIWGCLSIRCPKCGLRLLWYAISKKDINEWVAWIFKFVECPKCNYNPSPVETGR